jgi:hypothetical protein
LSPVKYITHGNQTTGRNDIVRRRKLRKSVTTTNNGFVKCRVNVSCEVTIVLISSFIDFDFKNESKHEKGQSKKNIALANIRTENEAQRKAKFEREIISFSIKIYTNLY